MRRSMIGLLSLLVIAGCFSAGDSESTQTAADVSTPDTTRVDVETDASPCGCSGDTPVCDPTSETCVECLSNDHCTSDDTPYCNTESNTCAACSDETRETWYPDYDGDGFGDADADGTTACERPEGTVANADDCDDREHTIHPDAAETCDGTDQDCDGVPDTEDDITPRECELQAGVCSGAMATSCDTSGFEYEDCESDTYGGDYTGADDENWRCDGLDNDCDGEVDEACCGESETPTPVQLGSSSADQTHPTIVPKASGAPRVAAYLAAWVEGDTILLQHLDENGNQVGQGSARQVGNVSSLALSMTNSGYVVTTSLQAVGVESIILHTFDSNLSLGQTNDGLDPNSDGRVAHVSTAVDGETLWVTYSYEKSQDSHVVRAATINLQNGMVGHEPFQVSPSGDTLPKPAAPEIAMVDGIPTVAWWSVRQEQIRGAWLDQGVVDSRFSFSVGLVELFDPEPIALFGHDGEAHIVHPDYVEGRSRALTYATVESGETGTLEVGEPITGDAETHRQPAATPVSGDEMLVVWARGPAEDPSIVADRTDLGSPSDLTGRVVRSRADNELATGPMVANGDEGAGTIFAQQNGMDAKYAPLSTEGVPICE